MLPEAFHQVSAQEDRWFERCWLKSSKMTVKWMAILNDFSNSWSPFCLEDSHQFSAQEKIWV